MKTKNLLFAANVCLALCSIQFISCKKDSADISTAQNASIEDNAVTDLTTDALNKGLVAWYTFNGDVLDHSGHNNNIVFNSARPAKGKSGVAKSAYLFDGSSSYMQVNNSNTLNPSKISLYALVKPKGFYQGTCHNNYILAKETTDYDQGRYILGFGDQAYYNYTGCDQPVATKYENFLAAYGDGGSTASGAIDLGDYVRINHWYSIVYTYDGQTSKLYVNGVLKNSVIEPTTFTPTTTPLYIGKTPNESFPYYFNGVIDEIRIYKRVLKANEVLALYNNS